MLRPIGPQVADFAPPVVPGPTKIAGRYAQLERLNPDLHAGDLFAANAGQDWVWDYMDYGPFATLADYTAWQQQAARQSDPCYYAIRDLNSGKIGGLASFLRIAPADGVLEIGHIEIAPTLQRSHAATEAIIMMITWAFQAGYRRVEWKCDALNAPSMAAARRYGFSYEGTFRQHMIYKGRNRDTAWWAIIDPDWPRLAAAYQRWLSPDNFTSDGKQIQRLSEMTLAP